MNYLEIVRYPSSHVPTDDEIFIDAGATDEQLRYVIRELVKLSARQQDRIAAMEEAHSFSFSTPGVTIRMS